MLGQTKRGEAGGDFHFTRASEKDTSPINTSNTKACMSRFNNKPLVFTITLSEGVGRKRAGGGALKYQCYGQQRKKKKEREKAPKSKHRLLIFQTHRHV